MAVEAKYNVPKDIKSIFGKPPLVRGEESHLYDRVLEAVATAMEPLDIIDWFYVKDVADLDWEILRYRRFTGRMIDNNQKGAFRTVTRRFQDEKSDATSLIARSNELAQQFVSDDAAIRNEVAQEIAKLGFDEHSVMAEAFEQKIEKLGIAHQMLARAESRREKILMEYSRRRKECTERKSINGEEEESVNPDSRTPQQNGGSPAPATN